MSAQRDDVAPCRGATWQNLRIDDNPIEGKPHLEAGVVVVVGPTLQKLNDGGQKLPLPYPHLHLLPFSSPLSPTRPLFLIHPPTGQVTRSEALSPKPSTLNPKPLSESECTQTWGRGSWRRQGGIRVSLPCVCAAGGT